MIVTVGTSRRLMSFAVNWAMTEHQQFLEELPLEEEQGYSGGLISSALETKVHCQIVDKLYGWDTVITIMMRA